MASSLKYHLYRVISTQLSKIILMSFLKDWFLIGPHKWPIHKVQVWELLLGRKNGVGSSLVRAVVINQVCVTYSTRCSPREMRVKTSLLGTVSICLTALVRKRENANSMKT